MTVTRRVRRRDEQTDTVAVVVEEPLEIRLGGVALAVVMRTPGHDRDLIRGFALTEGIIVRPGELARIVDRGEGRWEIVPAPDIHIDPERFRRNLYATSSCGVCGKASIDAIRVTARPLQRPAWFDEELLHTLPPAMRERQIVFDRTGGLHAAALFDPAGAVDVVREDIGRHNAVDKVIGAASATRWPLDDRILLVSGRVSFEIVQKAAVAGIPVVAGISAPSSLAIDLAAELGMTLVAFLRDDDYGIYATGGS